MSVRGGPELKRYMDKRLSVKLSASRNVIGVLRGYDNFMNLVLADTVEVVSATERNAIGTVVRVDSLGHMPICGPARARGALTRAPRSCAAAASSRWSAWTAWP